MTDAPDPKLQTDKLVCHRQQRSSPADDSRNPGKMGIPTNLSLCGRTISHVLWLI